MFQPSRKPAQRDKASKEGQDQTGRARDDQIKQIDMALSRQRPMSVKKPPSLAQHNGWRQRHSQGEAEFFRFAPPKAEQHAG